MHTEITDIADELHLDLTVQETARNLLGAWDVCCSNSHQYHMDRGPAAAASVYFAGQGRGSPVTRNDVAHHASFEDQRVLTQGALMKEGMNVEFYQPSPSTFAEEYVLRLDAQLDLGLGSEVIREAIEVLKTTHPTTEVENWQLGAGAVLKTSDATIDQLCEVAHCSHTPLLDSLMYLPENVD